MSTSLAGRLAALPVAERRRVWASLSESERAALAHTWDFWARPSQLPPPGAWSVWLIVSGRGWGKNRCAGEFVRREVEAGRAGRVALVSRTAADSRDTMVEGESGLLAISPPWFRPTWEPSKRRLTWPNGAIATTYSADEPSTLRGPQHDLAFADEIATWHSLAETWANLQMGLRLGTNPRTVATTTPRPVKLLKELLADPTVATTRGTTWENLENLAVTFQAQVIARYANTRLGRQELNGELLEDAAGALWRRDELEAHRVAVAPELTRLIVAVDPSGSAGENSDACGIVVAGVAANGEAFVLEDRSGIMSPAAWGRLAVNLYNAHKADRIVAEVNFGASMVAEVIRGVRDSDDKPVGRDVAFKELHASRSKFARAEPIAALFEQGRCHMVGSFPELEDELCSWEPNSGMRSPNRLDALVWCLTELMLGDGGGAAMWIRLAKAGACHLPTVMTP